MVRDPVGNADAHVTSPGCLRARPHYNLEVEGADQMTQDPVEGGKEPTVPWDGKVVEAMARKEGDGVLLD